MKVHSFKYVIDMYMERILINNIHGQYDRIRKL